MVKLGEVAKERRESIKTDKANMPIVGLEHLIPQQVQLTEWSNDADNTFTKLFHKGDVLFGRRRAYLKKASLAPFDGICSGDITVIAPIENKIAPELLPFIIQNDAFFDYAVEKSAGSLSPRVKWEHLKNYEFKLPGLEEQRKLAKILWAAEETKQTYKKLLQKTDDLVKAKFEEMFGNVVKNSKKWPVQKLIEVAPESNAVLQDSERVWLLNLDMIEEQTGKIIHKNVVNKSEVGSSTTTFNSEMVLYSKLRPYLNKVVVPDDEGYATTELVTLKPNKTYLNKYFLATLLRCNDFVKYAVNLSGGARMPRMPMNELRNFQCIIPPLNLQNKFVEFARHAEKSKLQLQTSLDSLNATMRALINENLK